MFVCLFVFFFAIAIPWCFYSKRVLASDVNANESVIFSKGWSC